VPAPAVTLSASASKVAPGQSVTLSWSSRNATGCSAGADWQGTLATNGSRQVGPLDATSTFRITCTGSGGSAIGMTTVEVTSSKGLTLSWIKPDSNEDGTPVRLSGYRVRYGQSPGEYTQTHSIRDPKATSFRIDVVPGTWYLVMTAVDSGGLESEFSNEVRQVVN
jgi:hypothetical protein